MTFAARFADLRLPPERAASGGLLGHGRLGCALRLAAAFGSLRCRRPALSGGRRVAACALSSRRSSSPIGADRRVDFVSVRCRTLLQRRPHRSFFDAPSSWRCSEPIMRPRDSADRISSESSDRRTLLAAPAVSFPASPFQAPPRGPMPGQGSGIPRRARLGVEQATGQTLSPKVRDISRQAVASPKIRRWPSRFLRSCC